MAKQSWHDAPKDIETDLGLARRGAPKRPTPLEIHDGMRSVTRSNALGDAPTGDPPDASSPLPTDPERQHGSKTLPIPSLHPSMKSNPERGSYRPDMADKVMGDAARPAADFAPLLHTLPAATTEE